VDYLSAFKIRDMENSYTKWQEYSDEEKEEIAKQSKLTEARINVKSAIKNLDDCKSYRGTGQIKRELDGIYYRLLLMNGC